MDLPKNTRYQLSPSAFYRVYDDVVVVYDTREQKVYTFNETAGDILACFETCTSLEEAASRLLEIYEIDDQAAFLADIGQFVQNLADKGILESPYEQVDVPDNLEKQISSHFEDGEQLLSVTMELTYRCNERCRHCYIVNDGKDELGTETIKRILDDLAEMKVLNIVFTGGEVFVRKDAFEILEYAYAKHFVIDIFTNGNLIDGNDFIRLKRIYPRCMHFSLYSHIPEKHDAVTQVKGSFDKTLHAIRSCISIGIPVNIKTPVFAETMEDVPGLVALAQEAGCSVELGRNITPKKDGDLTPLKMKIESETDNEAIVQTIRTLIPTMDNMPGEKAASGKICGAGDRSISIDPYGKVFPCNMLQLCIGDVNQQRVQEIWAHSEKLQWWRAHNKRSLRKGCESCEHAEDCRYCPGEALMWTGDSLKKYEEACLATKYLRTPAKEGQ